MSKWNGITGLMVLLSIAHLSYGQDRKYILALSKGAQAMRVLDYQTLDSVTSVSISADPHEVTTNEEGTMAYISHPVLTGAGHLISIIDLQKMQLKTEVDTRPFYTPHGLFYQKDKLWFTAQGSKAVAVYDTRKDSITEVFGTGQDFTHLIQLSAGGHTFYTSNVESGTISIYEHKEIPPYMPPTGVLPPNAKPRMEWRQKLVNVGFGAEGFDITADEKELWTARPDGHIIVVDLLTQRIKADIDTKVQGLHRLKICPDGKSVAIVSVKTGALLFYNRINQKPEQKMIIGRGAGIYMDKAANRMFVSCTPDNYIVVIDLNTRKVIRKIPISRPDAVTSVAIGSH